MNYDQDTDTRQTQWLTAGALALCAAIAMWLIRSQTHVWGDDFAGYIMQAKAITSGSMSAELSHSTHLLSLSDSKFGPPAYPWGYPVMLWFASLFVGWDINMLKPIAYVANAVIAGGLYLLARKYVSRPAAIVAALFVALQPTIVGSGDSLSSDVPSLAVNVLALLMVERLARAPSAGQGMRVGMILCAAIVATLTFSVRSNGAFIAVSMFAVLAYWFVVSDSATRRVLLAEMAVLTVVTTTLFLTYLRVVPDGSLAHAGYLTLAPSMLIRRLIETIATFADVAPFTLLRKIGLFKPVIVMPCLLACFGVCAVGAWRHRAHAAGLVVFGILNFLLLLTFPDNGGTRYLFPTLVPLAVLGAAGISALAGARIKASSTRRIPGFVALGVIILGIMIALPSKTENLQSGPFLPASDSLFAFVKQSVPDDAPISFFKPRALRLYTGKAGVAVTQQQNLSNVRFVVFDKREADGKWEKTWQVNQQDIESFENGKFSKAYENSQFIVYRDSAR